MYPQVHTHVSISTDGLSFSSDSVTIDSNELDIVTGVDVSFSDRTDDILSCVFNFFLALWKNFDLKVMANELVIKDRNTKLHS